ncbi:MAG: hypothetical protein GX561_07730 [Lentisphaerae bacterium]|jgi:autotransporter passenger strand-loop-strand repeat protein|nr:hypothetical protein [Lentisphaerota bacterium]
MAKTYYVYSGEIFTTDEVLVQLDAIHVYSGGTVRDVVFSGGDCTVYAGGLIEGGDVQQ